MKILIAGAGQLGRLLARQLCATNEHDVTIVDSDCSEFERLREKLDLMAIEGSATDIPTLKKAGIEHTDLFLAVSGDENVNLVSCSIAEMFGVRKTICRRFSSGIFSETDHITPAKFGIWKSFSSPEECAQKVMDVLQNKYVLEKIRFSNPDALMEVINITPSALIAGVCIKDFPGSDILGRVRIAGLVRDQQFLIPHGDTIIVPGDKIYVAGSRENVAEFEQMLFESRHRISKVVISGATRMGHLLTEQLLHDGYNVCVIEKDMEQGERLLDDLSSPVLVIHGDPTDREVMEEAGVDRCDAFVSTENDDESAILSCILAKRFGAGKVIAVTSKPEYIAIVPAMDVIDCGFNSSLVSLNTVLRLMDGGVYRIEAQHQRFLTNLTEFRISKESPICGKALVNCNLPPSAIFAMLFRGGKVLTPSGSTVFHAGDTVAAIVTSESAKELEPYFQR